MESRCVARAAAWPGHPSTVPQGSITGALVIDSCARHGAREEIIVVIHVPAARRRPRTQLDVAGELEGALGHVESLPEGEPLIALGRASMGSHERLQPDRVDELEPGQIDDHTGRLACLRIQLTVEQNRGGSVQFAAQPQDQHVRTALGADGERPGRAPFWFSDHGELAAVRHGPSVLLVHTCSKYRSSP
jgi:hypothetical protein